MCSKKNFKKINSNSINFISTNGTSYCLDIRQNYCPCRFYLKWKICSHLLAYEQLIFKRKNVFVKKPKSGRPRLTKTKDNQTELKEGRRKTKNGPALSYD